MRFLRWWLAEHTDIGHTTPTAVMLFADQGDPDHPEPWPPADAEQRTYRLPCHQTGCTLEHDVRPASVVEVLTAIGATLSPPAKPVDEPRIRVGEIKQLTVWWPVSAELGGLPADWTCPCGGDPTAVGYLRPDPTLVCGHCRQPAVAETRPTNCPRCDSHDPKLHPAVQHEGEVHICPHPWHTVPQAAGSSRGGRMSGTVS